MDSSRKKTTDSLMSDEKAEEEEVVEQIPLASKEDSLASSGEGGGEGVAKEEEMGRAEGREEGVAKDEEEGMVKEDVTEQKEGVATEEGKGEEGVAKEGEEGVAEEKREQEGDEKVTVEDQVAEVRTGEGAEADHSVKNGSQTFSPGGGGGLSSSESEQGSKGHPHQPSCSSTDELLAIMGVEAPNRTPHPAHTSQTTSESSVDNLLSEHPCFLHLRVSHKCSAAHTYTPVNMVIGIDIPQNQVFQPPRGVIQQVRTTFCFAVAERW